MKGCCEPERVSEGQGGIHMGYGKVPQTGCTCLHGRKNQRIKYGRVSMVILVGFQDLLICPAWVFSKDEAASVG